MGLLATRWDADYLGHTFSIQRNELTKGFEVTLEGTSIAKKRWSLIGVGDLEGTIELEGRELAVKVSLGVAGDRKCQLWIDGSPVPCRQVE